MGQRWGIKVFCLHLGKCRKCSSLQAAFFVFLHFHRELWHFPVFSHMGPALCPPHCLVVQCVPDPFAVFLTDEDSFISSCSVLPSFMCDISPFHRSILVLLPVELFCPPRSVYRAFLRHRSPSGFPSRLRDMPVIPAKPNRHEDSSVQKTGLNGSEPDISELFTLILLRRYSFDLMEHLGKPA